MICDKEYYISYKLYAHFPCSKLEYYFIKEEYTYFKNYWFEELKNEKILCVKDLIKNLFSDFKN